MNYFVVISEITQAFQNLLNENKFNQKYINHKKNILNIL